MRTKTRGGRARLSKIPCASPSPSPTPTADTCSLPFPSLNPDEGNGGGRIGRIAPESFSGKSSDENMASADSDNDNDTEHRVEMRNGLDPGGDWLGESCIICDRGGGNVLVCSGTGCPIALHGSCMNSGLKFDDAGNFYCPYCWYKREVVRTRELRKKAMEAKKVLLCFIDLKMAAGDKGKKDCGRDKGKAFNVLPHGGETNCGACKDRMDDDQVESQFVEVDDDKENDGDNEKFADSCGQHETAVDHQSEPICDDHNPKKTPGVKSSVNTMSKGGLSRKNISESHEFEVLEGGEKIQVEDSGQGDDSGNEGIVEDSLQTEPGTASGVQEENNVVNGSLHLAKKVVSDSVKVKQGRRKDEEERLPETSGTEMSDSDAETILMHQKRVKQKGKRKAPLKVDSPKRLSSPLNATPKKVPGTRNEKVIALKRPRRQGVAAEKITNVAFYNEKRKRLHWTAEEEEMLKEGVQKFSTKVNKNLPWRKILEFGRHVFDPTRNPADLKDKWRNILAKESSTANRS